jgi:ribonuclease Z
MSLKFELTILGSGSATPTLKRNPSAQVLNVRDHLYLIDCGEGTQVALRENKIKFQRIESIFITHLHGDHYLGLQGLISTFSLLGRKKELHIYSPPGLKKLTELQFQLSGSVATYPIQFHEIDTSSSQLIMENEHILVQAFPLKHRVTCYGFLFKEKKKLRHINGKITKELSIPNYAFDSLKKGENFTHPESGEIFYFEKLTLPADPSYTYAYCSDTKYFAKLSEIVKGVDLLYHESTFLHKDLALAKKTMHSTSKQAATLAKKANVKKLLLGHYSSRYPNIDLFLEEAKAVFENSYICEDGDLFTP